MRCREQHNPFTEFGQDLLAIHSVSCSVVIIASGLKAAWFAFVIMSIGLTEAENLTRLLVAWGKGERSAFDELAPAIYGELRRIAACHMRRERSGSLQPTALVHEAYIRLLPQRGVPWQNRAHFY